jgi:membrane-associated phospholipid phosphatase
MDLTAHALLGAHWTVTLLALISPATVLLAITLLGVLAWVVKGATAAVEVTCTAVGTILAAIVLKALLERPMFLDNGANSLPSGHVAAVAGVATAVALVTSRAVRPIVIAFGVGSVALTGVATLALGWHRPSDVIASALVAVGAAATTRWAVAVWGLPARSAAGPALLRSWSAGGHRPERLSLRSSSRPPSRRKSGSSGRGGCCWPRPIARPPLRGMHEQRSLVPSFSRLAAGRVAPSGARYRSSGHEGTKVDRRVDEREADSFRRPSATMVPKTLTSRTVVR